MSPTYGEQLVTNLLKTLPKGQYFSVVEPHIATRKSAHRNPDFVIVGSRLGVIVVEVKDWKRFKKLSVHEFEIERENGEIATETSPVKTAEAYTYNLVERFEKLDELFQRHRGKRKLKFPWTHAVILTHADDSLIKKCEDKGLWDPGQVIGSSQLTPERFEQALHDLPWVRRMREPLDMQTLDVIRGVLEPELIIEDDGGIPLGILTVDQERLERQPLKVAAKVEKQHALPLDLLSEETEALAETLSVRLVRGVAGSGKSLVLARRAQYLADQYPDMNLLVLAFNKDLVGDLKRRIPGAPNLEITNFHQMCRRIMGERWHSPQDVEGWLNNRMVDVMQAHDFSAEFVAEEIEWRKEFKHYDNHAYLELDRAGRKVALNKDKRAVINHIFDQYRQYQQRQRVMDWSDVPFITEDELKKGHALAGYYDIILIDEAQDFAPSWLRVVKQLLKTEGNLFLCDDPTQSLFRSYSWKEKGIDIVGRTRVLKVPFRCTREITMAAHSLIQGGQAEEILEPDLTTYMLVSGERPVLAECRDMDNEVKFVEQQVLSALEGGVDGAKIAILCHNKNYIRHWAYLRNKGCYVGSFNQMKGLEFEQVFVPYLHTAFDHIKQPSDESALAETRKRIFTAMTRARERLILSYQNALPGEMAVLQDYTDYENVASFGRIKS